MKHTKVLVSALLISVFVLNCTGCVGGKSFGPEALAEYAEKKGAESYKDADDWSEAYYSSDEDFVDNDDGVYIHTQENTEMVTEPFFYNGGVEPDDITRYFIRDGVNMFTITSMTIIDHKLAERYFGYLTDDIKTSNPDLEDYNYVKSESDFKRTISVVYYWGDEDLFAFNGFYYNYTESVVLRVIAVGEKDDVLDIVEDLGREFDLDLPEDM
jgi:hypothetical protein